MSLQNVTVDESSPVIYCVRADQGESASHRVSKSELSVSLKVNTILAEHVYVSASHLLASDATLQVIETLTPLVETGAIVVGLREDCADLMSFATHFLESRQLRSGSEAGRTIWNRARRADALLTSVVRWSPHSQQELFKQSILASLKDYRSVLRRRLTATPRRAIQDLIQAISEVPKNEVSRRTFRRLALAHAPHRVNAIMREVNLLYYTVGSSKAGLVPDLCPEYYNDVTKATKESLIEMGVPQREAFRELLNALILPGDLMDRLSPQLIVTVRTRYKNEIQRFRGKWWTTLQFGQQEPTGQAGDKTIHEILREAVARETKGLRRYDQVSRGITIGSLLVSLASLIPEPTLAALSFAVGLIGTVSSSDLVKHRLIGSHLHVLGTRLQRIQQ